MKSMDKIANNSVIAGATRNKRAAGTFIAKAREGYARSEGNASTHCRYHNLRDEAI